LGNIFSKSLGDNLKFGKTVKSGAWAARRLRAVLLASSALCAVAVPARAQDATWLAAPGSGDFNTAANWNPAAVPTGTAFFGLSTTAGLSFSADTAIGGWTFNPGASAYTFTNGQVVDFNGAGIVINGGSAAITNSGDVTFLQSSSAGSATIINTFNLFFRTNSTAGSAGITNYDHMEFRDASTAGSASVTNNALLFFTFGSTAGSAAITNNSSLFFLDTSTAGSANITNNSSLTFGSSSTAGSAAITNASAVQFSDTSTAGNASITNTINGVVNFRNASTAGNATIANNAGGIVNFYNTSTAGSATIANNSSLAFNDTSTAGSAGITNNNFLNFNNASTAGNATITNTSAGLIGFSGSSTAGSATIVNNNFLSFADTSTAGNATIANNNFLMFVGTSTAGSAAITTSAGSATLFANASSGGSATITTNAGGSTQFFGTSSGGNATITTNAGGFTQFSGTSSGGNARFITNASGALDISGLAAAATGMTAGSIEGAGAYYLGSKQLTVGGNGLNTTVGGVISDCGSGTDCNASGATGGSLVKAGTGTLTLSGINTYTGGTTINAGTLQLGNGGTTGSIRGAVTVGGSGTFSVVNANTSGITSISNAGFTNFHNATSAGSAGITNTSSLYFFDTSSAGSANITNSHNLFFYDSSTAGNAAITNSNNLFFNGSSSAGSATITSNGTLIFNTSSTAGSATITNTNGISFVQNSSAGSATIANSGNIDFYTNSSAGSAAITNTFDLIFRNNSTAGSADITNHGLVDFRNASTAANATIHNDGTLLFEFTSTGGNATVANSGSVRFGYTATGGNAAFTNNGGTIDFSASTGPNGDRKLSAGSIAGDGTVYLGADQLTLGGNNLGTTFSGVISDCGTGSSCYAGHGTGGALVKAGTGVLTLTGSNIYTGGTTVTAGTLQLGNGGTSGSILGAISLNGGNFAVDRSNTVSLDGAISGSGSFSQIGAGNTILTAANTYTGATSVNAGTLSVNGSILNSNVTVNAGGTLGGNGTVGNTTINNGGALLAGAVGAPGTLTVNGSLMMTSAAAYVVFGNATAIGKTVVTGTAGIGGMATISLASTGGYHAGTFTILVANGGLNGTFSTINVLGTPGSSVRNPHLVYDAHEVFLVLDPGTISPLLPNNTSANARAVAAGFDAAILSGANPGGGFNTLLSLSGAALTGALSQASGETAAGSQATTFSAMTQFVGLLLDPFLDGRGEPVSPSSGGSPFAEEESSTLAYASNGKPRSKSERDAYAAIYRKAPVAQTYDPRWSVWAAGFGGSQTTDGNGNVGSNSATSRVFGTAAGADYIFSPRTIAGFALAGGGTNFSVANGGSGRSDLFQAGAFIRHNVGAAYISGALAYGWQDITTDRTVTIAGIDRLRARFNANAYSGRVEGGYRFVTPWMGGVGLTPYAAGQFTTFNLPAYVEQVLSGANTFALAYASKSVTASRSELGVRTDKSWAMQDSILTLRGRLAWAHDFNPDRSIAATFQTLPGASFVVNGAAQASDSALTTAAAEIKWLNGFSLAATFEGEFSNVTRSYAGKGVARYAW
jgi:autotransporter-associated beta strand protein